MNQIRGDTTLRKELEEQHKIPTVKKPLAIVDKLLPLFQSTEAIVALYGGGSSAKSYTAMNYLIYKALKYKKRRMYVFRRYIVQHRDSCWVDAMYIIDTMNIVNRVKIDKTNYTINFLDTGSQIIFRGLDDHTKIKSVSNAADVFIEEADEITEYAFDQLTFRLRAKQPNKQIILCYNPPAKTHWLYKRFHEKPEELKDTLIIHTIAWDNPYNDERTFNALMRLKETNYDFYLVYALGLFGDGGANVFNEGKDFEVKDFDVNKIAKQRRDKNRLYIKHGADTGFDDPTTFNSYLFDLSEREIYIYKELHQQFTDLDDIVDMIEKGGYANSEVHIDGQNKIVVETLKKKYPRFKAAKKYKILERIAFLKGFKVFILPECEETIKEFKNYAYEIDKMSGQVDRNKNPIDLYNHHIDNLGYAAADLIDIYLEEEDNIPRNKRNSKTKLTRNFWRI